MATPAPPCARCGWILRWFQPQFAWVCDRCRGIFPAAVPGSAAMTPGVLPQAWARGAAVAAEPRRGFTLSRTQLIALAVGAVVIAGGIAAYALIGGKSAHGGVARSRDELVRRIVAALDAHDLDAAMALADYDGLERQAMDCDDPGSDSVGRDRDRIRDGFKKEIERTHDARVELVKLDTEEPGIGGDHKPLTLDKGDTAGNGCKFKVDVELQTIKFSVRIRAEGESREKDVEMYALVINGEWHLLSPPSLEGSVATPDCWEAVRNAMARSRDEMMKMANVTDSKLDDVKYAMSEMCRVDAWSSEVLTCLTGAGSQSDVEGCMRKLTPTQMSAVTEKLVKIISADP